MIRHLEVGGVPAVIAPAAGPMRAGLMFRVGLADETLARIGITHLVEHLVLHPLGHGDYHHNGATGAVFTSFHVQGSESDVAAFLTGISSSLDNLALHRLEMEKDVLRTEAAGRGDGVAGPLAVWRHGARDHGLPGYPEWGLSGLTAEHLRDWVARYFTRDNAVLWIAGDDVPAGLALTLPAGIRQPVPAPSSTLPVTPAYFPGTSTTVAWNAVVPRSAPASVFSGVLQRMMFREMRQEAGLSYMVQTDYEPRGDGMAVIAAVADALPEKQDAVLGAFVDVLAAARVGRIDPADVTAETGARREMLGHPDIDAARLPGYARDLLTGQPVQDLAQLTAELDAVTPEAVVTAGREALDTGLLMTPSGRPADWAGFAQAPPDSAQQVRGAAYPSLDEPGVKAVLGDQGASLVGPAVRLTVRFDACAAVLAWPDGARTLIGHDAIMVRLEPTLHRGLAAAIPALDARVPRDAWVTMPARDPERIPQPSPAAGRTARRTLLSRIRAIVTAAFVVLATLFFGVLTAGMIGATVDDPSDLGVSMALIAVGLVMTGLWGRRAVQEIRRLTGRA